MSKHSGRRGVTLLATAMCTLALLGLLMAVDSDACISPERSAGLRRCGGGSGGHGTGRHCGRLTELTPPVAASKNTWNFATPPSVNRVEYRPMA